MLLAARVKVASAHHSQGQGALFVLAETLAEQLVVPEAQRFKLCAPRAEYAAVHGAPGLKQVVGRNVVEHRIIAGGRIGEAFGHGRRALKQAHHIDAQDGGRKQTHCRENRVATAEVVGDREDVSAADVLGEVPKLSRWAGNR